MRGSFSRSKTPRMGATLDGASRLDSPMSGASRLDSPMSDASRLEVVWEEVLAHPTEETPAPNQKKITPPPQNFFINELRFFITRQTVTQPVPSLRGHWLVSYEELPAGGAGAGAAAGPVAGPDDPEPPLRGGEVENRDYVKRDPQHYDVGEFWLRPRLEEAERKDYQFAVRMQVIQPVSISGWFFATDSVFYRACKTAPSPPSGRAWSWPRTPPIARR